MSQLRLLDNALRQGLGLGARLAIGETFDVYRLNAASTGNWIQPNNQILSGYSAKFGYGIPKSLQEQTELYKMMYTAMCDTRPLKVMDILVETGPTLTDNPDGRAYILVDVRPLQGPVFARLDFYGSLSRPNSESTVDEPLLGDGGYQGTSKFNEWPYQLVGGNFYVHSGPLTVGNITSDGSPCAIPIGMQQHIRVGPAQNIKPDQMPTETPRAVFFSYIPILPGEFIQPGDVISNSVGDRFQVENIGFYDVGIQGYQIIAHSIFV